MTNMDDRQKAFESKYAYDQEVMFKIEARACKLFGLWIAEQIGLTGDDAAAYATSVITANLDQPGFDDVLGMVAGTLAEKSVEISSHTLETKLAQYMEEAREQVVNEQK
jgi:hypothetical protein